MLCTATRRAPLVTGALALLVVACLVECASGSCLSYGHSCWGAHGKRSGRPAAPASAEWYINRMLRRMPSWNKEMDRDASSQESRDLTTIFRGKATDEENARPSDVNEASQENVGIKRISEGIPMIDDDALAKAKFWQIMKEATED